MNTLKDYFTNKEHNAIHKWLHYFDIYESYFQRFKNKEVVILEIGVYQGGSLQMWKEYFGKNAKIYGIDINPLCKRFETESIHVFIGSQDDRDFLKNIKEQIPKIDILIDDGGHEMHQQKITFEELFDHINEEGIYVCEDLHTSYWNGFGGGYKNPMSFIEYSKSLIDYINAWHSPDKKLQINNLTKSIYSLHFYNSILVIEKRNIVPPECKMIGEVIIPIEYFSPPYVKITYIKIILKKAKKGVKFCYNYLKNKMHLSYLLKRIQNQPKSTINRFTPLETIFLGKKLYIHDINSFNLGYNELFKQEMYKFIANKKNPYIVDCGANLGMSVIYFKELYPESTIVAFEPDSYIFEFLNKNVASFGYNYVELINAAVWDSEGIIPFLAEGGAGGRIETGKNDGHLAIVKTVRLKDYITCKQVDFLKIDIEGAEYQVLKDCSNELHNVNLLFIEYHSLSEKNQKLHEILEIISNAGFRYQIKEAYSSKYPFIKRTLNFGMDLQLNIFCYRN